LITGHLLTPQLAHGPSAGPFATAPVFRRISFLRLYVK